MDYYSFDSEVIESLNLLRPPVKRDGISETVLGPSKNIQVLNLTSNCGNPLSGGKNGGSSTSLVLEKTSKTQILKQYSVVSYPNEQERFRYYGKSKFNREKRDKPLIKVTVIPRSYDKSDSKLLRKRRFVTKTIQGTSSDHNNSIQTKNLYLVVAGRKEDKIYEIKTTGSAKFERLRDDKVGISHQIFHNFTMERKKKRDAKKEMKINKMNEEKEASDNFVHVCQCCPGDGFHDAEVNLVKPGKSRVKIFGKLGLTQNDKYVLKCHATVDDKPVSTFMSHEQFSYESVAGNNEDNVACSNAARIFNGDYVRGGNRDSHVSSPRAADNATIRDDNEMEIRTQRDSVIQADFRLKAVNDLLLNIENQYKIRKESQSTQVDLTALPNRYPQQPMCMQTRCSCNPDYSKLVPTREEKNLKACQSPLVIISVFPKQDNNLKFDLLKAVQEEQAVKLNSMTMEGNKNIPSGFDKNTTPEFRKLTSEFSRNITSDFNTLNAEVKPIVSSKKKSRSRSPSPKNRSPPSKGPKSSKTKPKEVKEFRQGRAKVKAKHSKVDQKNLTKQPLQFFNSQFSEDGNKRTSDQKSRSPEKQNRSKDTPEKQNKTKDSPVKIHKTTSTKPKTKRKVDIGINTEHLQTKKALVDSYTKVMLDQSNKEKPPGLSISKVSVNIDSGNELFDLTYQQNGFTTDLDVRKTMRDAAVPQSHYDNRDHRDDSMENLFPRCFEHGRSIICQSGCENQSTEIIQEGNNRRLAVRDSLEISHRREDKILKVDQLSPPRKHKRKKPIEIEDETDCSAAVRHFTGDSCVVCDPIARDKEIRRLLGVPMITKSHIRRSNLPGAPISRCCLYPHQCNKTLTTAIAIPIESYQFGHYQETEDDCPHQRRSNPVDAGEHVVRGHQEVRGIQGDRGYQGDRGIQGDRGYQDDRGIQGDRGYQDGRCIQGERGYQEDRCIQGDRGIQGDRRYHGDRVIHDERGYQDDRGIQGDLSNQDSRSIQVSCGPCGCKPSFSLIQETRHIHTETGRLYTDDTDSSVVQYFEQQPRERRQSPPKISFQEPSYIAPAAYEEVNVQTDVVKTNPHLRNASVSKPEFPQQKDASATQHCVGTIPDSCECGPLPEIVEQLSTVIIQNNQLNPEIVTLPKECVCVPPEPPSSPYQITMCDASTIYEGLLPEPSIRKRPKKKQYKKPDKLGSESREDKIKYREERTETKPKQSKISRDRAYGDKLQSLKSSKELEDKDISEEKNVQQLTLNRNVQVFLQMEQFSKQKPIVLSRKQYKKVKKTIQRTLCARDKGSGKFYCKCKHSLASTGEIKDRQKSFTPIYFHQEVQTEKGQTFEDFDYEQPNQERLFRPDLDTIVLFSNEDRCPRDRENSPKDKVPYSRHAVSSVEMRYASVALRKQEAISSTNVVSIDNLALPRRNDDSFETIFRGRRKSHTPNLGTSALSLQSEANISKSQSLMVILPDTKTKKPFLRRLISCLVMKSRTSDVEKSVHPPTSKNSSVDSYHISTSFGAIEMSSSLYDTSASFYSDHGIYPLNSKLKRSFFSSVRGFLASRSKS